MAGIKGKSGLGKGRTNNPNGRPVGSKNKNTSIMKKMMEEFAINNFQNFLEDWKSIEDPGVRANLYLKVAKPFIPQVKSEEEEENLRTQSAVLSRLFGGAEKKE